jgi:hypothetical protein
LEEEVMESAPFSGPGGRRRGDKSILRLCEMERSDENIVLAAAWLREEVMKSFLIRVGKKVQLFRDRGCWVGDLGESR